MFSAAQAAAKSRVHLLERQKPSGDYMSQLERLDKLARLAFDGNFAGTGVLSTGELLYVALASGRMKELCPSDSNAYAVQRIGPEWMAHMQNVWRSCPQPDAPQDDQKLLAAAARYDWIRAHPKFPEVITLLTGLVTTDRTLSDEEIDAAIAACGTHPSTAW